MDKQVKVKFYVSKHDDVGDFVKCCDCGRQLVVKHGVDDCPACGAIGTLVWADPDVREVNVKAFKIKLRET